MPTTRITSSVILSARSAIRRYQLGKRSDSTYTSSVPSTRLTASTVSSFSSVRITWLMTAWNTIIFEGSNYFFSQLVRSCKALSLVWPNSWSQRSVSFSKASVTSLRQFSRTFFFHSGAFACGSTIEASKVMHTSIGLSEGKRSDHPTCNLIKEGSISDYSHLVASSSCSITSQSSTIDKIGVKERIINLLWKIWMSMVSFAHKSTTLSL